MNLDRRTFLVGLAAPAIVRYASIMPVRDPMVSGLVFHPSVSPKLVYHTAEGFTYLRLRGRPPSPIVPVRLSQWDHVFKEQGKLGWHAWSEIG
jgi:hypothetical protein